ncbi:hypothetical protein KBZ18_04440 [Synechococcus sp. Cruz-9H2]|jgi:hypothetical protein|uniref:hypothetical protein n=1 Tax=unclassified Synechococcus TaxID=2626047 RepID=UPI0020CDCB38|nr:MULTISPECIES: hypothetical protein [unclassified Synechococcus]MCP9818743.1 hypothetical protein [Synechococcus sp. Cruz-9H2]MCP9842973.1 hypothetical protein [Synechococcus sp. Edmonson 11F2]MCP9855998.1 hypothetical protein [Synechococcus sp. Cruz-9C9]MCP9862115.1 hypothetical protein [Synechococcus sp. Cruz-7E5]MCP9869386.1 hypothetical protein [Synechococcus sp. Cruz-7B9]
MEINHPDRQPLTSEEQALLQEFRQKLNERVLSVGLTSDDVRHIVEGLRLHPNASLEVIQAVLEEARALVPGRRLLTFDWE